MAIFEANSVGVTKKRKVAQFRTSKSIEERNEQAKNTQ